MRWSSLILNTTVALFLGGVFSIPVDPTGLERRMDNDLPYDSKNARKQAAANVGQSETGKGKDAGHIASKDFFDQSLNKANIDAKDLSPHTQHMHEEQTVPEPSGQNRGAGKKEAENVKNILGGDKATKSVSQGHRDMQLDPQNQALAKQKVGEFKDAVKADTGKDMPDIEKDVDKVLNEQCKRDLVDENGMLSVRSLYDENGVLDRRALECALPPQKGSTPSKKPASGKSTSGKENTASKKANPKSVSTKAKSAAKSKFKPNSATTKTKSPASNKQKKTTSKSSKSPGKPKSSKPQTQKKPKSQGQKPKTKPQGQTPKKSKKQTTKSQPQTPKKQKQATPPGQKATSHKK